MAGKDEGRRGLAALFRRGDAESGDDSEVTRLLEINRALLTELDPRRLYSKILDAAVELTGAERAFLLVVQSPPAAEAAGGDALDAEVAASRNVDREEIKHAAAKVSRTVVRKVLATGASQIIESALEDPSLAPSSSITEMRLVSILALPLNARGRVVGCLYLDNRFQKGKFTEAHRELMERFADQAALAFENARLHAANEAARLELEQLNSKLKQRVELQENELQSIRSVLEKKQEHVTLKHDYPEVVGRSPTMLEMLALLDVVVETDYPVLILGESGVGKEIVARAIHRLGRRSERPFVAENCSAIAENLLEAELFGHVKGAYTGADRDKTGLFEEANGGTLLLDEIGDMDLSMQRKLLRVLQEGEFRRVGGREPIKVDVRILSATNVDLATRLKEGSFREDLYFRLKVMSLRVPPLRERRGDIPALVKHFLTEATRESGRPPPTIADDAFAILMNYSWPGNVRELKNEVFKLAALAPERIDARLLRNLGEGIRPPQMQLAGRTLEELEKEAIKQALEVARGKRVEAARLLGLPRRTFYNRLKRYGLL